MSKKKPAGRCIVTYGRSLIALEIAHSLAERGVEVIGCDDVDLTVMSFSRDVKKNFVHAPSESKPEKFLDDLEKNIRKYKPEDDEVPYVLIPAFRDIQLIAENRDRFESHIQVAGPTADMISKIHPKQNLARTAEEVGAHAPRSIEFNDIDGLKAAAEELGYPFLVKPWDGVGGRGVKALKDEEALQAQWKKAAKSYERGGLAQQLVEGEDYCLAVLFQDGELKAHMAYRNLMKMPAESGAGIMRETIDDAPFLETAKAVLGAIGWHGVAEIDFRWDGSEDTAPAMIEINPRFWMGIFHSIESGVDFPWLLYEMTVKGEVPEAPLATVGKRTKAPGVWLLSAIQDIASSDVHFDEVRKGWKEAYASAKDRKVLDALKKFGGSFGKVTDIESARKHLKKAMEDADEAQVELFSSRDPFASLGVLFVIASLVRHGKLPPELTHS